MKHNLKALGLTLVATFAFGAMAATAASAAFPFHTPKAPTYLTGTPLAEHTLILEGGKMKCASLEYTGTIEKGQVEELRIDPDRKNCSFAGFTADVSMPGCLYAIAAPTINHGKGLYTSGTYYFECPPESPGIITPTLLGASVCTITVLSQEPPEGSIEIQNEGAGEERYLKITFKIKKFIYTVHGGGGACGKPGEMIANGETTGSITLKGYSDKAHKMRTAVYVE